MSRKYGRAWKRIRDRYAKQHPKCEKCGNIVELINDGPVTILIDSKEDL